MDKRFDRLYILKIQNGQIPKLKELCDDYKIDDNDAFKNAADFHIIWGLCPTGLIYLSYTMAMNGIDFNSLEELEDYLDKFEEKN